MLNPICALWLIVRFAWISKSYQENGAYKQQIISLIESEWSQELDRKFEPRGIK